MNWHEPTQEEKEGQGDHTFLVDIFPDTISHQAARDGDALLRIRKPGWSWLIWNTLAGVYVADGEEDTKDAAVGSAQEALAELRA